MSTHITVPTSVAVTGTGVVLPGANNASALLADPPPSAEPVDPAAIVGRKGLRYKDRATRLAYCAADVALRDAGLTVEGDLAVDSDKVGVVASSNFGNVDTVVSVLDTIHAETVAGTSPMDLPNASSNVIASSVAIRFGLRGPNLMVCNGATGGLDAVRWAVTMIATGRVERVLVVGTEPATEPVRRILHGGRPLDGAAALVVESSQSVAERGVPAQAWLGHFVRTASLVECVLQLVEADSGMQPTSWQVPPGGAPGDLLPGVPRIDLTSSWGQCSGALGVLQCAAAVGWFSDHNTGTVYATAGTPAESTAGLALTGGVT